MARSFVAARSTHPHRRRRIWLGIGIGLVVALVVFRLLLPGIVKRQLNHQLADLGRIPFEGTFDDVRVDVWGAIGSILRNTFLEALIPQLDHSIGIDDAADAVQGSSSPRMPPRTAPPGRPAGP